ncbi:MAG: SBBP repeat-containing protein [Betaproteobacteria bacterium]|nr:SBBP repeat-containing protein [Betaproteobacteria bacterium]
MNPLRTGGNAAMRRSALLATIVATAGAAWAEADATPRVAAVAAAPSSLAFPFVAASAQDDPRVAFFARVPTGVLFVTRDGSLVWRLQAHAQAGGGVVLTETPVGARAAPRGAVPSATRVSRFVGSEPRLWRADAPTFDRVALGESWPGIGVDLVARAGGVEKLVTVAPGADVRRAAFRLRGAARVERTAAGTLVAHTALGPVTFTAPVAWQEIGDERRPVRVAYTVAGNRYGFALGAHDRRHAVVIDPLLQATYAGGSGGDIAYATAVDAAGALYVAGSTASFNFPGTAGGAQASAAGGGDAFVAKLDRDLTSFVRVTYLGGSNAEVAQAMALDAAGNVYVAGSTSSLNFPGTAGGAQAGAGGAGDAFVARLSPDLATLTQATYVGGSAFDQAFALAVSPTLGIYVGGGTASVNFPATADGAQASRGGNTDAFVVRVSADLATFVQGTYLGGTNNDIAYALALDDAGAVFVGGSTGSATFPATAGGAQPAPGGGGDAFVAKLDAGLATLARATYVGGVAADAAYALALAADGAVFVAGETGSANFPGTAGGAQPVRGGGSDAFVATFDPALGTLRQATFVGGLSDDVANALAIDAAGIVYIGGNTASTAFPATAGGAQAAPGGGGDGFVARLDHALASLPQATYLGGSGLDQVFALAVTARGRVYAAGGTASLNLPAATGGAQASAGGGGDAFVAAMTASLALVDPPAIEYRHAEWDHYFVTANPDEVAKLDAGVFAGWARTGESFRVRPLDVAGAANVCRFFSVSFAPKSSHFYTPDAAECAKVKGNPDWQFEAEVFAFALPDAAGGCGAGTLPLYRLYNDGQGAAPNHRYTTSLATRSDMVARGWIPEGIGGLGVTGCVPA